MFFLTPLKDKRESKIYILYFWQNAAVETFDQQVTTSSILFLKKEQNGHVTEYYKKAYRGCLDN